MSVSLLEQPKICKVIRGFFLDTGKVFNRGNTIPMMSLERVIKKWTTGGKIKKVNNIIVGMNHYYIIQV